MACTVTKHPQFPGVQLYRDVMIERDDSARGFSTHWKTTLTLKRTKGAGTESRLFASTRKELLAEIDVYLQRSGNTG